MTSINRETLQLCVFFLEKAIFMFLFLGGFVISRYIEVDWPLGFRISGGRLYRVFFVRDCHE